MGDKIRKRLEAEKLELQAALEEAEGALEQEENKVLRAQLELTQVRQEIERRITEKEEEFMGIKKNMTKGIEGMQSALETESKGKAEGLRMKKKLESDVGELEMSLEHANANNVESQKAIKKYQGQIRDAQSKLEDESRGKAIGHDQLVAADRKAHAMQNALEEARSLLEISDRNRRMTEQELSDANESLSDATVNNQSIEASKSMVDAARLAEELRGEQDVAQQMEKARRILEAQSKDMAQRLDEAETNALKGGKKAMNKMETRVRELESELDAENRRQADAHKNLRRSERRINELTFASDEDRKNHERMQSLVDGLQGKIKTYKKQIEEAEEIAALNLAKFRKVAGEVDTAGQRADVAEQALGKLKAKLRASVGPM